MEEEHRKQREHNKSEKIEKKHGEASIRNRSRKEKIDNESLRSPVQIVRKRKHKLSPADRRPEE